MKTAVEELVEDLIASGYLNYEEMPKGLIFRAKQMEKEQMCECYNDGLYQDIHSDTLLPFEQYYNKTYKNTEK